MGLHKEDIESISKSKQKAQFKKYVIKVINDDNKEESV